ncbi:MAG: dockerin type I repeat-containing protein [Clostridia bacterium]|nr:dockerin type I repeat-containing protein [Clostridia bacterium]
MKRIIVATLAIVLAVLPIIVTAQPRYEANFSFKVSVNGKEVSTENEHIYVYNSDVLDVSLNLKTNDDYYAGPLCTEIFFSEDYLTNNTFTWNTNGRFYKCCKTYSNYLLQKNNGAYFKVDMIPTSADCSQAPNSLNESLLTMQFTAKGKRDDIAQINLDKNSVRNADNPFGAMYLACYTDNGNLNGERYDFGDEIILDLSKAKVKFKITDAGDVNQDGRISSSDALKIVQFSAGISSPDQQQKIIADVNSNGKINSSDGLAAMQIATGMRTINDIING